LAMFSLKYPSLLQFDKGVRADDPVRHNLRTLFGVSQAQSTQVKRPSLSMV